VNNNRTYIVALGANLPSPAGPPEATLRAALAALAGRGLRVTRRSRLFRTPCFPRGAGPDYVNAAACLRCAGGPETVLRGLHAIEAEFGRARAERWGRRSLDLDLIAADRRVLPDVATFRHWCALPADQQTRQAPDTLILPHPRLQDRAFVLVPLAEVAPDWRHPVLGRTVREMLADLPPAMVAEVVPVHDAGR